MLLRPRAARTALGSIAQLTACSPLRFRRRCRSGADLPVPSLPHANARTPPDIDEPPVGERGADRELRPQLAIDADGRNSWVLGDPKSLPITLTLLSTLDGLAGSKPP